MALGIVKGDSDTFHDSRVRFELQGREVHQPCRPSAGRALRKDGYGPHGDSDEADFWLSRLSAVLLFVRLVSGWAESFSDTIVYQYGPRPGTVNMFRGEQLTLISI